MRDRGKNIYEDLGRDLRGFPVEEFVRAYAKAYFEADVEALRKLHALLGEDYKNPGYTGGGSANVGVPLKPRPGLNSGAVALPLPERAEDSNGESFDEA